MRRAAGVAWTAGALAGCLDGAHALPAPSVTRAPGPPHVVVGELHGRGLLGDLPARASRLGAGAPSLVVSSPGLDNEWLGGFLDVPREACLLAYARAASSIEDVDVAVYAEDGTSLAVDEARDVHPTVVLCPPHPPRVYVAAHVVEGEGLVAVGAQLVPKDRAVVVARALAARGAVGQGPRSADGWPGLDDVVRAHRSELGGQWEEFKRAALAVDARAPTYAPMTLDAPGCVDAVVVPDEDVALLDVEGLDQQGRVVGRAKEGMGTRTLTLCSPVPMAGSLAVRPHAGRGLASIVLARAPAEVARDLSARPEIAWTAATEPLEAARRSRNALLAKSGYPPPAASASGSLALGRRVTVPLELQSLAGPCGRIDIVAGAPLGLLEARVWGDGDALLASGEAAASLALFACSRGPARLELEARGRPGPYAVLVRPETWKDPLLAAHPLASSRMLARAARAPEMLFEGTDGIARELSLDAAHQVVWSEDVAAGRCVRVTIGAQGDGTGVELRAFDGPDTEVDRAAAAHAASVFACAPPDASRVIRFEARATAGHLDAIAGERWEPR